MQTVMCLKRFYLACIALKIETEIVYMIKEKILVIGASGQIGVELTLALRKIYGNANVVASDLREENDLHYHKSF